jgi:pimeloyl-ACP methyl ester carboxylesterase
MRSTVAVLVVAAFVYLGACAALYFFQRSLIYFPQPSSLGRSSQMVLPVDGAELRVSVRPHTGPNALIYFGGNAEDVSASLPSLSTTFPEHAIFLMHYRGYGGSSGAPSEQALQADALKLFDKIHAEHPNIVVVGRSLGCGIAIRLAVQRPVSRLVLVTPWDSLQDLAAAQFPFFPVRWLLAEKYESGRYAPLVAAPTTVVAAEHDEVIPRWSTDRLHARFAQGVARFVILPGTGHNTISMNPLYLDIVRGAR